MKWINFYAGIAKAKMNIVAVCKERGYAVDVLDISETANIEFTDLETVKLAYDGDDVKAVATLKIEADNLRIDEIMIEMQVE